ncbi:MAG: hypothetical protein NTV44_03150 [Firmicutes bacterium]|nr:hypothetical protein [Bacillota bacterium]
MDKKKLILFPILLLTLTACGEDLANAMNFNDYRSTVFAENMYTTWPTELANVEATTEYDVGSSNVVKGFTNLHTEDYEAYASDVFGSDYAAANKLSAIDPAVAYGYPSKLFDGILHCFDAVRSTKSRFQLEPEGFGYHFPHEMYTDDYVGLFLKSGADTDNGGIHITDIAAHLSFYVLNDATERYHKYQFNFTATGLPTSDYPDFYGFYFDDVLGASSTVLQGTQAVSFTYEVLDAVQSSDATHAVFMYELLLPNSTWR